MKKIFLVAISILCLVSFTACAAAQQQQTVAAASESPSPSESGLPAVFQSPEASATSVMAESSPQVSASVSPEESLMAEASPQVSVSVSPEASDKTIDKIINLDALNSVFATDPNLAENGEKMIVSITGNTLTYDLTFNKDIKITDLPADFKTTMDKSLQDAIDQAAQLYPDLPSCTFVYNVINGVSGQILLTVTKDYSIG